MSQETEHQQIDEMDEHKSVKFRFWKFVVLQLVIILATIAITVCITLAISHKVSGLTKDERQAMNKIQFVYKTLNNDYYKNKVLIN